MGRFPARKSSAKKPIKKRDVKRFLRSPLRRRKTIAQLFQVYPTKIGCDCVFYFTDACDCNGGLRLKDTKCHSHCRKSLRLRLAIAPCNLKIATAGKLNLRTGTSWRAFLYFFGPPWSIRFSKENSKIICTGDCSPIKNFGGPATVRQEKGT